MVMDPWLFRPPVLVGERVVWLGSGSGLPQGGVVRWIGKLPEMGPDWTVGLQLDNPLPYGGIDGTWGNRHLFTCEPKHGLIVPITKTVREADLLSWPFNSHGGGARHGAAGAAPPQSQLHQPQPPARHRPRASPPAASPSPAPVPTPTPAPAPDPQPPQAPQRKPLSARPRPAARRRKRLVGGALCSSLAVIPEPCDSPEPSPAPSPSPAPTTAPAPTLANGPTPSSNAPTGGLGALQEEEEEEEEEEEGKEKEDEGRSLPDANERGSSLKSVLSGRTFFTCTSGDYSDLRWFDADEADTDEEESLYDFFECGGDDAHAPHSRLVSDVYSAVIQRKIETLERAASGSGASGAGDGMSRRAGAGATAAEDAVVPASPTHSAKRREKAASGFFSFFRWFRKGRGDGDEEEDAQGDADADGDVEDEGAPGGSLPPTPASLRVVRAHSASCGSIDTLFSTATVSSFAFVAPAAYRPFGPALAPEKWIAPGPDTDTYRQRVQERERAREQDRGLTLRRKYRLFGSDSHLRSPDASPRPARANFRSPEASPRTARAHVRSPSSSEASPRPERGHFRSPSSPETSPRPPRAHPQPQPASGTAATPAAGASLGRKKRRAPSPPASPKAYADLSLPSAWRKGARPEEAADGSAQRPRHRRAASESAKDKRAGAYCHVKGKRRAPPPPSPQPTDQTGGSLDRFRPRGSSFGRKKRPAPQPPSPAPAPAPAPSPAPAATASTKRKKDQETQAAADGPPQGTGSLPPEERERLLCDIAQLKAQAQAQAEAQSRRRSMGSPPSVRSQLFAVDADLPVVANDSLKLERGVLKPSKEAARAVEQPAPTAAAAAGGGAAAGATPPAPVSPRPWYKRSLSAKEPKRDLFKSLEKRKKRVEEQEEWAPEAGIPRVPAPAPAPSDGSSVGSSGGGGSRLGFLARLEERRSGGEKRRSQVSLLANISALDREAAEIVQKEQAREQALAAAHDARFYVPAFPAGPPPPLPPGLDLPPPPHSPPTPLDADPGPGPETPKRSSAKELISLFNAIGNVTKVTVNSAFFSREGGEKRFSFSGGGVKTQMATTTTTEEAQRVVVQGACVQQKHITSITTTTTTVVGNHQGEPGSDVVIQEVDEDEEEVNGAAEPVAAGRDFRRRRPLSPSIPTIDEQPEGASPAPTLPLGSSPPGPDALMLAKRLTIWACPRCTLENPRWRITCDACGRWRPADAAIPESATNANSIFTSFSNSPAFNHTPDTNNSDVAPTSNPVSSNPAPALGSSSKTVLTSNSALASTTSSTSSNPTTVSNSTSVSNPTPSSNPAPIPITAPTYNSVSVSNHVANPTPSPAASKGIDWERELRRYFPANGKTPAASKAAETPARPTTNDSKAPEEATKATKPKNDEAVKDSKSAAKLALPSTFIGGRTKADEKRQGASPSLAPAPKTGNAATTVSGPAPAASSASTPAATEAPDVDEVRKARLAFFSRDQPEGKSKGKEAVYAGLKLPKDEKEKKKLKEMLKEMKDSLPRRDPKGAVAGGSSAVEPQAHRGAVPKVLDAKAAGVSSNAKAPKVSTSCQTASVVRKVQAAGKGASAVPVTVEELWGAGAGTSAKAGAEGGLLYTSVGKPSAPPCSGGGAAPVPPSRTFELIRARDFATIEATKTAGIAAGAHVYANVPTAASPPPPPPQPARRRAHRGNESLASTSAGSDAATATSSSAAASPPPDDDPGADAEAEAEAELEAEVEPEGSACSTSDNSEVERLTAQLTLPKGLAAFKADLQAEARAEGEAGRHRVNTLAVNRLLRRLEAAIVGGQHHQAALLARDLARLRINCCVTRQKPRAPPGPAAITVDMYVEDKVSHQGPIPLQVTPGMTVAELKQKVEQQFEIPVAVQRWILGKMLASDDNKTLEEHNVSTNGCPMFLYLVAPEGEQESDAVTAAPAEPELPEEQVAPASPTAQPPPPPPPQKGGGWYYNHEDDRYSFCEDTESEMATDDEGDDETSDTSPAKLPLHQQKGMPLVPLLNTLNEPELEVREGKDDERENEEEEEDDDEEEEEEEEQGELGERPVLVQPSAVIIHDRPVVIEAPAATAIQKDVTPANVAVAGGSANHADIGTMKLGWKCPVCTLMNSPTRPGCAACTTERPLKYVVPVEYRANVHEMERIRKEAQGDQELLQAEANAKAPPEQNEHYQELVNLDNTDLVPNTDPFDCSVCFTPCDRHEGVVLRDCLHTFCKPCLVNTVQFNEEAEVKCPFRDNNYACDSVLQEREIKALVPQHVYEQHLAKSVAQAENKIGNTFHCKTPDCRGWCIFEDNVNEFRCPVCRVINCLTCQAIHEGINCKQYQEQVQQQSETNADARRTKEMLEEMVVRGEAMACPTCQVVLMKKWGCDWLRCSMCKTEICWVTRGPRWGPGGKGDTTGGCQCGLNGVKCHPRCNYCH